MSVGVVTVTLGVSGALLGVPSPKETVEPTAAVKRAVSSMGGRASRSRLGALSGNLMSKVKSQWKPRR